MKKLNNWQVKSMKNEECAVKNKLIKSIPVGKMENLLSFVFPRNLCFNINSEILQTYIPSRS